MKALTRLKRHKDRSPTTVASLRELGIQNAEGFCVGQGVSISISVSISSSINVSIHIHIHIHIHILTHTHTHTHIHPYPYAYPHPYQVVDALRGHANRCRRRWAWTGRFERGTRGWRTRSIARSTGECYKRTPPRRGPNTNRCDREHADLKTDRPVCSRTYRSEYEQVGLIANRPVKPIRQRTIRSENE